MGLYLHFPYVIMVWCSTTRDSFDISFTGCHILIESTPLNMARCQFNVPEETSTDNYSRSWYDDKNFIFISWKPLTHNLFKDLGFFSIRISLIKFDIHTYIHTYLHMPLAQIFINNIQNLLILVYKCFWFHIVLRLNDDVSKFFPSLNIKTQTACQLRHFLTCRDVNVSLQVKYDIFVDCSLLKCLNIQISALCSYRFCVSSDYSPEYHSRAG